MRSPALLPSSLTNELTATAAFGQLACAVGSLAVSVLNDAFASLPSASISLSFGPLNVHVTAASALFVASDCILVENERVHVSTSLHGSAAATVVVAIRASRIVRMSSLLSFGGRLLQGFEMVEAVAQRRRERAELAALVAKAADILGERCTLAEL